MAKPMVSFSKTQKIIAYGLLIAISVYALAGFYLLPFLIRDKLPGLLTEKTGLKTQLQSARFNPFSLQLELGGFALAAADGKTLAGFDSLAIDLNGYASITQLSAVFDSIILNKPILNIKRQHDGSFNFSSVSRPSTPSAPVEHKNTDSAFPVNIRHLAINAGEVSWVDESAGQAKTEAILPLTFTLDDLYTQNTKQAKFDLALQIGSGGRLDWQGELGLKPLFSKGRISLQELAIPKISQMFLQEFIPVDISTGRFALQTDYQASLAEKGIELITSKGEININQLEIADKTQHSPLIRIPEMTLHGVSVDLNQQQVKVTAFGSKDAVIKAVMQQDGLLNFQSLFSQPEKTANTSAAQVNTAVPSGKIWQISLEDLSLKNFLLEFTDLSQKKPQVMQLSHINFNLQKFSSGHTEKLPVQFSADFNQEGKLNIGGEISLNPFRAEMATELKTIKLKTFQNYLDNYLNLELVDGDFNTSGKLQLSAAAEFQLLFQGNANLAYLLTRDKVNNKDFLKWSDLQFQQIDIDLAQKHFSLGKVLFDHPYLRFAIQKDKTNNISDILVSHHPEPNLQKTVEKPATLADKAEVQTVINIDKIAIQDGNSDFSDFSLILPFVAQMSSLNGEIDGFTSDQDTPIKLALQGKVYDLAQVIIKGKYQIQSGDSDISLKFSRMPLPLITPYMADFAGYRIEKGQMALDLQYKINKHQLEAQNKIFIDQLVLGDQVENPHAVSLPLHLAIALLKDADGKINLDFPVTGSLDDPQFSVGALIVDVLGNLVEKLVSAPFQALGALFSEDDDYSNVKFAAGSAELSSAETAKLDQLTTALQNKPELVLEIKGMAYHAQDWPVLRADVLLEILKKMKSGELRDQGEKIRSEYIELSKDEYNRLLTKFFKEMFPQDIDFTLLGAPRLKNQPDADFYLTARQKLEAILQPEPQRLTDLAVARAGAISKYFLEKNLLNSDRVYILAPELNSADTAENVSVLTLNVAH